MNPKARKRLAKKRRAEQEADEAADRGGVRSFGTPKGGAGAGGKKARF